MNDIELHGLDGMNPLGFMAALGLLVVLSERAPEAGPRLAWEDRGRWRPVVRVDLDRQSVLDLVMADKADLATHPLLTFSYEKNGKPTRDVKAPPDEFRRWKRSLRSDTTPAGRSAVALVAALGSELVQDDGGQTKPTALHFTAGQQQFLDMVTQLAEGVRTEDLEEAMFGPWTYEGKLPVMGWDATATRDYALRASDPSSDKKAGVPGADWLAFRGLAMFPVFPVAGRLVTTCVHGGWKSGFMVWPLWTGRLSREAAQGVVGTSGLAEMSPDERQARGIGMVLRSGIRRSDQGGYGAFGPAVPA